MYLIFLFIFTLFVFDNLFVRTKKSKFKIIEIISSEKNSCTSEKNVINFLENKFLNNGKLFKEYKKPIIIKFDYLGYVSKIHMKYMLLKPDDKLIKGPGYMDVYIFIKRKKVSITKKFLEVYGHTKNFYSHIHGCYNKMLFMTMKEYIGKYIHIMDEYGKKLKYYVTLGTRNLKVIHIK